MGRPRKIKDWSEFERELRSGKSMEEIGKHFGITKSSVSKNAKRLRFTAAKDLALSETAGKLNSQKINGMTRLERLMSNLEEELGYIKKIIRTSSGQERRDWGKSLIAHSAELRQQLSLMRDIATTLYSIEQVEEFKEIVVQQIGSESPECRQRILDAIKNIRPDSGLAALGGRD